MYTPNGDPGYPDESELERVSVSDMDCEITEICDAAEDHEFEDDPPDPEDI